MIQVLLFNSCSITCVKQRSFMKYYLPFEKKSQFWSYLLRTYMFKKI